MSKKSIREELGLIVTTLEDPLADATWAARLQWAHKLRSLADRCDEKLAEPAKLPEVLSKARVALESAGCIIRYAASPVGQFHPAGEAAFNGALGEIAIALSAIEAWQADEAAEAAARAEVAGKVAKELRGVQETARLNRDGSVYVSGAYLGLLAARLEGAESPMPPAPAPSAAGEGVRTRYERRHGTNPLPDVGPDQIIEIDERGTVHVPEPALDSCPEVADLKEALRKLVREEIANLLVEALDRLCPESVSTPKDHPAPDTASFNRKS